MTFFLVVRVLFEIVYGIFVIHHHDIFVHSYSTLNGGK